MFLINCLSYIGLNLWQISYLKRLMAECDTAVTPLLMHWRYRSLVLSYWDDVDGTRNSIYSSVYLLSQSAYLEICYISYIIYYNIRYLTSVLIMHDISVIAFSMCYVKHKQELLISHAGMNVLINKTRFIHSVMNLYFYWKYHDSFHVNETRFTSSRAMEVFPHCLTPLWLTLNRWRGYLPPTPTPHPHPLPITKT